MRPVDPAAVAQVPLSDQIACVEREIMQRERVYPRLIEGARMSEDTAMRERTRMEAVLRTLRGLVIGERLI